MPIDSPRSLFLTLWSSEMHFFPWNSELQKSDSDTAVDFDFLPQWSRQLEWFLCDLLKLYSALPDCCHHKGAIPWMELNPRATIERWPSRSPRQSRLRRTRRHKLLVSAAAMAECSGLAAARDNDKKLNPWPPEPEYSPPQFMLQFGVFREKQCLSPCHSFVTTRIPAHPPPTPSTSFDKYSWITWDGPKGQGPETLPAWLSQATGKHSMYFREQVDFPPHKSSFVSV